MTHVPEIELLQHMPVFGAMSASALQLLLGHAQEVRVGRGEWFFRENQSADSMFVLQHGHATVMKGWQGRTLVLGSLQAGDCFGEMSLMDLGPRSASVLADTDCDALEIGAAELLMLFEHDVEQFALMQMNLGREVCRRLRATDELLFRARMGDQAAVASVGLRPN